MGWARCVSCSRYLSRRHWRAGARRRNWGTDSQPQRAPGTRAATADLQGATRHGNPSRGRACDRTRRRRFPSARSRLDGNPGRSLGLVSCREWTMGSIESSAVRRDADRLLARLRRRDRARLRNGMGLAMPATAKRSTTVKAGWGYALGRQRDLGMGIYHLAANKANDAINDWISPAPAPPAALPPSSSPGRSPLRNTR